MAKQHSPETWDTVASAYDGMRPDQGLTDPQIRAAWRLLLERNLPPAPRRVLDVGCGTGSLSILLAEMDHDVTGIDFSPEMIAEAERKSEGLQETVRFEVQDGSALEFEPRSYDAIVCRQTLWAMSDRTATLANWAALLADGGAMLLIEGRFASGNGMDPDEVVAAMPETMTGAELTDLAPLTGLWGGPIPDQRVLITATRKP